MWKRITVCLFAVVFYVSGVAATNALDEPTGEVILTVTGDIAATNSDSEANFDLEMLQRMPEVRFRTETVWTEGPQEFVGVSLKHLLDAVGGSGESLRAIALNDYAAEIPTSDAVDGGPIVAYQRNGQAMSVRDKGPLWIVYPYDSDPKYRAEVIYSRSIWQLRSIDVGD